MDQMLLAALLVAAVLLFVAFVLAGLAWLAARVRRRGVGNAVMGPFDEIWHPSGGHTQAEVQERQERVTPAPAPGDRRWPGLPR